MVDPTVPEEIQVLEDMIAGLEDHVTNLEETIEELETHLVDDHDCNRPSILERMCSRAQIRRRGVSE